jgi:hypothetical protein
MPSWGSALPGGGGLEWNEHLYPDRCRCQRGASRALVVIVIEESGLRLSIPNFDNDYDNDNDNESCLETLSGNHIHGAIVP